jgi:hypothetical protein
MSERRATTEGTSGAGCYDDHSKYQRATAATAADLTAECVAPISMPRDARTFVVADYGRPAQLDRVGSG